MGGIGQASNICVLIVTLSPEHTDFEEENIQLKLENKFQNLNEKVMPSW